LARVLGLPVESVWKRLYGILAQQVDRYVTSSHEEMELASEFVPGQKLEVALGGYGVDVQGLNPYDSELPAVGELRRQLGVPSTATHVVGLPADLPDRKRSSLANRLERRVPGAVCRTLGDAASDDVRHFFRALDVFVLPHDEPRWAQLAGACACPTVALNTRAHREIVVQGETGELADESSLIDATAALLADPGRLERYGVRARTRSVSRFDRRQVDDQLLRLYDGVLRGKMT
jgi:glycosyltransferase involved in cell wall biosynthesis